MGLIGIADSRARCRVDDHAGWLVRIVDVKYLLAGCSLAVDVEKEHSPLDRAAILTACDYFLAGITAFAEINTTHQFVIEHLRHELFRSGGLDDRQPALHFQPAPVIERQGGCI